MFSWGVIRPWTLETSLVVSLVQYLSLLILVPVGSDPGAAFVDIHTEMERARKIR